MKYTKNSFSVRIVGELQGRIWMPPVVCLKEFDYHPRTSEDNQTLRDMILHITNDGDFQSCSIQQWAFIQIILFKSNKKITRTFQLADFPFIKDCLVPLGEEIYLEPEE